METDIIHNECSLMTGAYPLACVTAIVCDAVGGMWRTQDYIECNNRVKVAIHVAAA